MNKNQAEGGFFSHLTELRKRLIHSLIFLSILFVICYYFSEYIYGFLVDPYAQAVKNDDVNRMKKVKSYKGIRHSTGHKVRGQRTYSNGRKGLALGVSRRKVA